MKRAITIAVFFVLFSQVCVAQWKQIFTFPDKEVPCLYFLNDCGKPNIGFAGVNREGIMKTTDAGLTWYRINCPIDPVLNSKVPATSITFKNEMEGWYISIVSSSCYHTLDGGENWQILPGNFLYTSIYYNKLKQRLFCTILENVSGGDVIFSDDGGFAWTEHISPTTHGTLGMAFSDDLHGCFSVLGSPIGDFIYTTDGGDSWGTSNIQEECWQPLGLPNTRTLLALNEGDINGNPAGEVYRSDNGGANWKKIYQYRLAEDFPVTGAICRVLDSVLLFQTTTNSSEGFMSSIDGGYSWHPLCGPIGVIDTRFYAFDSYIYACDRSGGLWLNTTGIGSNSTPQLSKNSISLVSKFCDVKEDTLIFTLFDSCNGRQAELLEASISGSNRFFVSGEAIPRTITLDDTIRIIYTPDPNSSATENATLILKFKLSWKVFDTTITLTGRNITPHLDISFTPVLTTNNLIAGKEAECNIYSSNSIQDRQLDKITFDITYNNDLLEISRITSQSGMNATYTTPIVINGIARLPITITGNNMTIDSLLPLISVKFRTYLTDTTLSTIELSTIQFNDDNPDYKNCMLSATGNSTTFTQASICGDSTIRSFMMTGKFIDILSIRPNPAKDHVSIEVRSVEKQSIVVEIFDALGNRHDQFASTLSEGDNVISASLSELPSGSYIVRIASGKVIASVRFVVF
jgi:photosystem II stability/assembly factor-like uncharacterized protein